MKTFDLCKEYCIGCGLCKSELHADMKKNAKGFWFPNLQKNEKKTFKLTFHEYNTPVGRTLAIL